jgi:hypothetical protein
MRVDSDRDAVQFVVVGVWLDRLLRGDSDTSRMVAVRP